MRKRVLFLVPFCFILLACPSNIASTARDTAAALGGAIAAAQVQYAKTCVSQPTQQACVIVNQAVAGQNALITATEAYCGWSTASPPVNPTTASCVPVSTAQAGLQSAINNANLFITELKGVIK